MPQSPISLCPRLRRRNVVPRRRLDRFIGWGADQALWLWQLGGRVSVPHLRSTATQCRRVIIDSLILVDEQGAGTQGCRDSERDRRGPPPVAGHAPT